MPDVLIDHAETPIPLVLVSEAAFEAMSDEGLKELARGQDFKGQAGRILFATGAEGRLTRVLAGAGKAGADPMAARSLAARLPAGDYILTDAPEGLDAGLFALGWALGAYVFDRYKARPERGRARLVLPDGVDGAAIRQEAAACLLAREMVDTPAQDMGPLQIETIAREIAEEAGASIEVTVGDDLLEKNFPAVHAVGRAAASHRQPRLIEIGWNLDRSELPLVALVGKGVVFDSGGLDIKPAAGMRWMKKDMGGAAHAIALAELVMARQLPVRITLLVPAVENAIGPDAFRPGEVIATRTGISVEIDNTDAEGRVVLGDALAYACEGKPDLLLDFATLTGAARVALGPELPALYSNDDAVAQAWLDAGIRVRDPLWRMPLWRPYLRYLTSQIADIANSGPSKMAGSIAAALYLERFVAAGQAWAHVDGYAWNDADRPGRPAGGEAQGLRAAFAMLKARFASQT